ncbi:MAG: DEAD/DEAH box helicase family protein [Eggerthella lenta]
MAALEFKFSSDQQHQLEAIEATCDLFRGQQFIGSVFSADSGRKGQTAIGELMVGHGNELRVAPGQLLDNLHAVQEEGCLPATDVLTDGRLRDFTVEMETGTGKTYVYIRSIYELNRRYGITKFVIVVPSVAIREGVLKSLQTTRRHFETLYDRTPLDYFVYDSKDMGPVGNFATSSSIQVMVINIDAFNKGLEKDGTAKEGNLFHRPSEKLTGGFSPRELVSACKPVVIIDEPQSVDNTKQAKAAIKSLNPLFVLRYSATHKQAYNMIYRLTPVDAFERHLVKGICVDSIKAEANLNGAYVRLESVKSDPFSAKVSIDVRQADGTQKRKAVTVKTGNDLYQKSGENSDYESGWVVNNIGAAVGDEFIEFQNGEVLELGEALGDVNEEVVKRAQIRRTIEDHLARQFELWPRGVKVLSLLFIDRVDRYRVYEPEVHGGLYALMFEEEYAGALNSKAPRRIAKAAGIGKGTWLECYEAVGAPLVRDPHAVHQGYFAKDKKGKFKDSKGAAGTADDAGAFELIMQKKETLISFPDGKDADKDVSFVFSHSALKEGWDNPNVFQICTLVETKDNLTKRQKIGRGLRLCVNQDGERLYDPEANVLTVIANESYDDFANGLQKELEAEDFKFGVITPESFTKVTVKGDDGVEERLGYEKSKQVYDHLVATGMVDGKGAVTPELKAAAEEGKVELLPSSSLPRSRSRRSSSTSPRGSRSVTRPRRSRSSCRRTSRSTLRSGPVGPHPPAHALPGRGRLRQAHRACHRSCRRHARRAPAPGDERACLAGHRRRGRERRGHGHLRGVRFGKGEIRPSRPDRRAAGRRRAHPRHHQGDPRGLQPPRRVRDRPRDLPRAGRRQDQPREERPHRPGHQVRAPSRGRVVHHARPRA